MNNFPSTGGTRPRVPPSFYGKTRHIFTVNTQNAGVEKNEKVLALQSGAEENVTLLKNFLPAADVLVYRFETADGKPCAAVYTDGITDKQLLGELAARPLSLSPAPATREEAEKLLLFPEIKSADDVAAAAKEILSGNPALLIEGICGAIILGTKKVTLRAISEPQTSITVKGPREGFIEDVKTNMSLVRRRLINHAYRSESVCPQPDVSRLFRYIYAIRRKVFAQK